MAIEIERKFIVKKSQTMKSNTHITLSKVTL